MTKAGIRTLARRGRRLVFAGVLGTGLVVTAASAAGAASVQPIVECVFHDEGTGQYNALWGYNSTHAGNVTFNVPGNNTFSPDPKDRGQQSTFSPGVHNNVLVTTWDGAANLRWTVNGTSGTAQTTSPACSSNPVSVVGSGWASLVTIIFVTTALGVVLFWRGRRYLSRRA